MAEERFESIWRFVTLTAGDPWPLHISLRSVVERQRANGREEFSLRFRSLRVVKERKYHARGRDYTFLSAQLNRVRFYAVEYAMRHPHFILDFSTSSWSSVISRQVLYIVSQIPKIDQTNVRRRNVRQFFARIALQARISYTWFVPPKITIVINRWTAWRNKRRA